MERPRFSDHLEAIKFICKDFWSELFKKQIDNLKTNHRVMQRIPHAWFFFLLIRKLRFLGLLCMQGTFVLQDNRFRWLTRVSLDPSAESTDATDNDSAPLGDTAAQTTSMLLYFPCGLIRGALTNLGISCSVSADMSNLPACKLSHAFLWPCEMWFVFNFFYKAPYFAYLLDGVVNLHCTSYINQVKEELKYGAYCSASGFIVFGLIIWRYHALLF